MIINCLFPSSGALILSDMRQWKRSLDMFEMSIKMNANLFKTFVHKLVYLKFKILMERGFDEELCFRSALSHRSLDDCLHNIECEAEDTDSHILQLIINHKNEWLASDSAPKNMFSDFGNDFALDFRLTLSLISQTIRRHRRILTRNR